MVFVPVIVPPAVFSTRSRELSVRLEEAIQTYQQQHPEVSRAEVAQALSAVQAARRVPPRAAKAAMIGMAALLAALVGVFVALGSNGGELPSASGIPVVTIAVGVGVVLVAGLFVLRRSSEE